MSQRVYLVSQQLIANNLELISATSWQGYQQQGRGVVLIDGETVDQLELTGPPLVYVSGQQSQQKNEDWPVEQIAGLLEKYDPDTEVIVVVKWRGEVGIYRFKPAMSPPVAYQSLNETLLDE